MLKNYGLMYIVILLMLLLSDVSVLSQDSLPSIKLIIPKDTPVICTKPYVPVKAIIYGVEDKDDIEVSFNDQYIRRYTYDTATNVLRMQVDVKEERNVLNIQAENNNGSTQFDLNINYQNPLSLLGPNIEIVYPETSNFIVYRDTIRISVLIEMVSQEDIIINLNGHIIEDIEYNLDNEVLSALLKLDAGENYINIAASNSGGLSQKTIKVIYRI